MADLFVHACIVLAKIRDISFQRKRPHATTTLSSIHNQTNSKSVWQATGKQMTIEHAVNPPALQSPQPRRMSFAAAAAKVGEYSPSQCRALPTASRRRRKRPCSGRLNPNKRKRGRTSHGGDTQTVRGTHLKFRPGLVVQGRAGAGAGSQSHLKHTTHHTRYDQYTSHTRRTVHCGDTLIVHKFQKGEFPFVKMVFLSRPNLKKKSPTTVHNGTHHGTHHCAQWWRTDGTRYTP